MAREVSNRSYIYHFTLDFTLTLNTSAQARWKGKGKVQLTCRFLVFHGGSGSTKDEIREAVVNGVVKMNVDTDTQWAYLTGIRDFVNNNADRLAAQVVRLIIPSCFSLCPLSAYRAPYGM